MKIEQSTVLEGLSKLELQELADGLLREVPITTSFCVEFVCSETRGVWHGRARAMMCRRIKHISLDTKQSRRLVVCVVNRLTSGRFSEQFKDQLRLVLFLDSATLFEAARDCRFSKFLHVRGYAEWVSRHEIL